MGMEVAVFVGEAGETVSINEPGKIVVYRKQNGVWTVLREIAFSLDQAGGLNALRQQLDGVTQFLDSCKVFMARCITGIPYYELEKAGCSVWEFAGRPHEFLDYILFKEEEDRRKQPDSACSIPVPVHTGGGCYHISLKDIQGSANGITSKQVLLPFLRKETFYSMEVICSHIPPWLEAEFAQGNLSGISERTGLDELRVTITKNC